MLQGLRGLFEKLWADPYKKEPKVIDTPAAKLRLETGNTAWLDAPKVAVVSAWSPTPNMSKSFSAYLFELSKAGYVPFVVSTTDSSEPLQWPHGLPGNAVVARRPNVGYDFGSYSAALNAVPGLRRIEHLLLTNDSMVGPFSSIDHLLAKAEESEADICGLTESHQYVSHPQTFFLMFRKGVLDEPPMRRFFDNVRQQGDKVEVIQAYELGLSRHCAHEGFSWEAIINAQRTNVGYQNPTLYGWEPLLEAGVPFLKRNILLDETRTKHTKGMPTAVLQRYGEDVRDWLPEGYELPDSLESELK